MPSVFPTLFQQYLLATFPFLLADDARKRLLQLGDGRVFTRLVNLAAQSTSSEVQYNSAGTIGQLAQLGKHQKYFHPRMVLRMIQGFMVGCRIMLADAAFDIKTFYVRLRRTGIKL